jgi:thermostable 8-oxoguanine DNA glycosylase
VALGCPNMIDPTNITNFNLSDNQLEEVILFWICAAGKNAIVAASSLDRLLNQICEKKHSPFESIRNLNKNKLPNLLKNFGIGCYNNKAKTFWDLSNSGINLRTCSANDLENIYGIGMKTSRCFIIHSRKNAKYAGLDVHILKFMKLLGYDVPKSTPIGKKYLYLEKEFLRKIEGFGKPVAEIDLLIWNHFSQHKNVNEDISNFFDFVGLKEEALINV